MNLTFQNISEATICKLVASAKKSTTLYAPGVSKRIAHSLLDAASRGISVRFLTDISPYALRLGYFDKETLRILVLN